MKQLKFISAIALTMVMASCDDFDLPNPPGQTYPEPEAVFENSGIQLAQGEATVNLIEANKANEDVNVATITELLNFPAEYELEVQMQISGDAGFSKPVTIGTTIVDNNVMVNPDVFNGGIQEAITKNPGVYDVYARYLAYAVRENTRLRLGGLDAYFAEDSKYSVTTLNPVKVMEEAYYVVPCDANGVPQMDKAVKMNNTGGNISVYDNPEFALKVNIEESQTAGDGYLWMLAPQSAVTAGNTDGVMGTNAEISAQGLSGKLVSELPKPISVTIFGPILLTVNVEKDSYSISYALENLWPLSGSTASKPETAMILYTYDYISYTGVSMLNKNFVIAGQPDQKGAIVFRQADTEIVTSEDGYTQSGDMTTDASAARISTPIIPGDEKETKSSGLFYMNVNLIQRTYEITWLSWLGVVGKGNGWDAANAVRLTPSKDYKTWTASDVAIDEDFKINANGAWAISFSGSQISSTGELVYQVDKQDGGANLSAPTGIYDVTVDFTNKPYIVTLKKK